MSSFKTQTIMSQTNNLVFKALLIIAWLIFIGLCIEAGGLVVNFIFSLYKPEALQNLYQKLDLTEVYAYSRWVFFGIYSFILFIAILKVMMFYTVIRLVHKMDLAKPFNSFVSEQILKISQYAFSIGIISHIARQTTKSALHNSYAIDKLSGFWVDSEAFILMAAVVYIIAKIFAKGIELQNENDLTV